MSLRHRNINDSNQPTYVFTRPFAYNHPYLHDAKDWLKSNTLGFLAAIGGNFALPNMPLKSALTLGQWMRSWPYGPLTSDGAMNLLNSSIVHVASQPNEFDLDRQQYELNFPFLVRWGAKLVVCGATSLLAAYVVRPIMEANELSIDATTDINSAAVTAFAQTVVLSTTQSILNRGARAFLECGARMWSLHKRDREQQALARQEEYHALDVDAAPPASEAQPVMPMGPRKK